MEKEQKITAKEKFLKLVKELLDYAIEDFHKAVNIAQKEQEFKDGDILHSKPTNMIIIFKSYKTELKGAFCSYYNSDNRTNSGWLTHSFRHATEKEKQAFFDDLREKGLHWNAETKTMEKVRKRAKDGEKYLYINEAGIIHDYIEDYDIFDNKAYNIGNYYLISEREEAEEDAKAIRAIFEKRKKVIQD